MIILRAFFSFCQSNKQNTHISLFFLFPKQLEKSLINIHERIINKQKKTLSSQIRMKDYIELIAKLEDQIKSILLIRRIYI